VTTLLSDFIPCGRHLGDCTYCVENELCENCGELSRLSEIVDAANLVYQKLANIGSVEMYDLGKALGLIPEPEKLECPGCGEIELLLRDDGSWWFGLITNRSACPMALSPVRQPSFQALHSMTTVPTPGNTATPSWGKS